GKGLARGWQCGCSPVGPLLPGGLFLLLPAGRAEVLPACAARAAQYYPTVTAAGRSFQGK
ncbi:MAG: hypothetical protein ABF535_07840, partial [Acetobacter sp.]